MDQGARARGPVRNTDSGFTLIELTVVIVILGIMLTLVIPRLGDLGEADLKRSARHLTSTIRFLRGESQARKEQYWLRFDVQGGRYWVEWGAEVKKQTGETTREFRRLQSEMGSEGSLSGNVTFRDVRVASHPDDPYILFSPNGWVEPAVIHLRDGEDRDFTLRVKPLMGDTELLEGYIEER